MKNFSSIGAALVIATIVLSGCAPKLSPGAMAARYYDQPDSIYRDSIAVEVKGINNEVEGFEAAVKVSLKKNHLLANNSDSARYNLTVRLEELVSMVDEDKTSATSKISYSLMSASSGNVLVQNTITKSAMRKIPNPPFDREDAKEIAILAGKALLLGPSGGVRKSMFMSKEISIQGAKEEAIYLNLSEFLKYLYEI